MSVHCMQRVSVLSCLAVAACTSMSRGDDAWRRPFEPDKHTVVLYHFDEATGNQSHDATGDKKLTLRAFKRSLWGRRPGFGTTARFDRQNRWRRL